MKLIRRPLSLGVLAFPILMLLALDASAAPFRDGGGRPDRGGHGPGNGGGPGWGNGPGNGPGHGGGNGGPGWGGGGNGPGPGGPGWGNGPGNGPGHGPGHGGPGWGGGGNGPGHGGPGWNQPLPPPPPQQVQWLAVHRFYQPQHLQTLDYNEGMRARMAYEGVSFYVLSQPLPGTAPIYRCIIPGTRDRFVSGDARCEGFRQEGLYGFLYQQPNPSAPKALYRCYGNGDHLSTTNPQECSQAGYRVEHVQGFTP